MNLDQWSHYWHSAQLTSLPQDFSGNYDGEIQAFWHQAFARLNNKAAILDLCTGNGAIALLAQQYSDGRQVEFSVTAVDGAQINTGAIKSRFPALSAALDRIQFVSGQAVESMHIEQTFDLITSQYGIEYCDWDAAAASIASHLNPGGYFAMICHAPDTDISRTMQAERDQYQYLEHAGFFQWIKHILDNKMELALFSKHLKQLQKKIKRRFKFSRQPLMNGINNFCQHILSSSPQQFELERPMLKDFYEQHLYAYHRLSDILGVAERIEAEPDWYQRFCVDGISLIATEPVMQQGQHLAGISYLFQKEARA